MRVIAGEHGKRKLKAVPGKNTRPTTDKIKESVFNMIGPYFDEETTILDFYAGSGALGIEALSRGAHYAYFCERNRQALTTIRENITTLGLENRAEVLGGNNLRALAQLREQHPTLNFDLVFLDPPYKKQQLVKTLTMLVNDNWLKKTSRVICEMEKTDELPDEVAGLGKIKDVTYGITRIVIYTGMNKED